MKHGELKQAIAELAVGDTITVPANNRNYKTMKYRVPFGIHQYARLFQYKLKTFNDNDGVIQVMRTQ